MAMLYGVYRSRNGAFRHRRRDVMETSIWFQTNVFLSTIIGDPVNFDKGREKNKTQNLFSDFTLSFLMQKSLPQSLNSLKNYSNICYLKISANISAAVT